MRQRLSLSVALCALVILAVAPLFAGEEECPGKQLYIDQKCNMCHPVSTAGIEAKMDKGDLVGLADQYDAEWLMQYLKKEADKDGKTHGKAFKGTDEELKVLVDWLLEQKAE